MVPLLVGFLMELAEGLYWAIARKPVIGLGLVALLFVLMVLLDLS